MRKYTQLRGGTRPGSPHLNPPTNCDLCRAELRSIFYDVDVGGYGRWGCLCPRCYLSTNSDIGPGKGQIYKEETS